MSEVWALRVYRHVSVWQIYSLRVCKYTAYSPRPLARRQPGPRHARTGVRSSLGQVRTLLNLEPGLWSGSNKFPRNPVPTCLISSSGGGKFQTGSAAVSRVGPAWSGAGMAGSEANSGQVPTQDKY